MQLFMLWFHFWHFILQQKLLYRGHNNDHYQTKQKKKTKLLLFSRAEIGFRRFDKKRNLTKWLLFYQNLFVSGLKVHFDSDKKKEKRTIKLENLNFWQLDNFRKRQKDKSTFWLQNKRRNVRNHWFTVLEIKPLFVNLWQCCADRKQREWNIRNSTAFVRFGWKLRFDKRLKSGFRGEISLNGWI